MEMPLSSLHHVLATMTGSGNIACHFCLPLQEMTMSDKHKQPKYQQTKPGKPAGPDQNQANRRNGIEPEEQHREGGNRISDQGGKKPGADKH